MGFASCTSFQFGWFDLTVAIMLSFGSVIKSLFAKFGNFKHLRAGGLLFAGSRLTKLVASMGDI
jgi:hypothetical protein